MKTLATATLADLGNGLNAVLLHSQDDAPKRTDAELIDLFIVTLGKSRADTEPPFGEFQPDFSKPSLVIDDPKVWYYEMEKRPLLTFRHHGYGFLSFDLTQESAEFLLQNLQQWKARQGADAPPQ